MLTALPKPIACAFMAILFYVLGFTLCIFTENGWYGLLFLGTLRFIIEMFRP